jgi:Sec-independent protein translocase protein TatA
MMALLTSKVGGYLIGAIAAVALVWWGYNSIYNAGYQAATAVKNAEIVELKAAATEARDKEANRQVAANNAAKAREAERIAQIQAENDSLEDKIKELQREASEDPNAGRVVLGAPSVQRINKVR